MIIYYEDNNMKMIILSAGQGSRLRPLTNKIPKCMVEYNGKRIIDYILETAKSCSITDIAIIGGYKKDVLEEYLQDKNINFYENKNFNKTNMVSTLFYAKEFMNEDLIISYSDIIYTKKVLSTLINSNDDFSIIIDKKWKDLWIQRMDNPLDDAETLKIVNGNIIELGKKAKSYDEIEGQYIGLIKISKRVIKKVIQYYDNLDRKALFDGNSFDDMYMTSFIQSIIDNLLDVKPSYIYGEWAEFDTVQDLNTKMYYSSNFNDV